MDRVEERAGELMVRHHLTLGVAESCTGGLIGHRLTNVAGSSTYYMGSVIVYAYEAKVRLLGVRWETLEKHGAVSGETVIEMARGVRRALGADIGMSVTGIAGPGGGLPGKPVGLVYICLSARDFERVGKFVWNEDRAGNKWASSEAALQMLQEYLTAKAAS